MKLFDSMVAIFSFVGVPTATTLPARQIEQPPLLPSFSFQKSFYGAVVEIGSTMKSEVVQFKSENADKNVR